MSTVQSMETIVDRTSAVQYLIDQMAPMVALDGGELLLVSVDEETGVVVVQLRGACSSCAISASTLESGVGRILQERLPWVSEVRGSIDEDYDLEESSALGTGAYVPKWRND
jgi:Fe-S cluster biogenesis protein NfuA